MGLLRRLLGTSAPPPPPAPSDRPAWLYDGATVTLFEGNETLAIVGESHYQDNLWRLADASTGSTVETEIVAILVPEEHNAHDPNAVSVWVSGLKVGYLSRDDAPRYRPGVQALMGQRGNPIALAGHIRGGGSRDDGPGMLGVFLLHDPADFGLAEATRYRHGSLRTGLTDAQAIDAADDTYDLDWLDSLPAEPVKRIPRLRKLLGEKTDDRIDRHFMFDALESDLYYCRDTFPSALAEFDQVCEQHHAEMEASIREALMEKFGAIPLLRLYKQACIRKQKQHDWDAALIWAERGLTVYGDNAARPEAVEDLNKRASAYRSKAGPD